MGYTLPDPLFNSLNERGLLSEDLLRSLGIDEETIRKIRTNQPIGQEEIDRAINKVKASDNSILQDLAEQNRDLLSGRAWHELQSFLNR